MIGFTGWCLGIYMPTVISMLSYFYVRRSCATWKDYLMDKDMMIYPSITDFEMDAFRQMSEDPTPAPPAKSNPGLTLETGFLAPDEHRMLLEAIRGWFAETNWSLPLHEHRLAALEREFGEMQPPVAGAADFVSGTRFFSDRHEDTREPCVPWGCGDALDITKVPQVLRSLARKIQVRHPNIGQLRHIRVDYSPNGQWYIPPRSSHPFDGHEYYIIPVHSIPASTVLTMTPCGRSRVPHLMDVVRQSWTSQDIDCLIPNDAILRVFSTARFNFAMCVRPHPQWFGTPKTVVSTSPSGFPEAFITLHFEGPVTDRKARRRVFRPEHAAFGAPPDAEFFSRWDNNPPTEQELRQQGIVWWVARNFLQFQTFM